MRIAMFGYQTWGHRTLQALLDAEHDVVLVVTHPPSQHAYERIWSESVADLATANGVPLLARDRLDEDVLAAIKVAEPDIIVANNWRTWISPDIFRQPPYGTLNIHDSLLPAYAGFSPLVWAVINGEREVGVTAHLMNETLDAGEIVVQRAIPVTEADTATDLFHATIELIAPIVTDALELISSGRTDWIKQDRSKASFFHKRSIEDSRIDWTWSAVELERLVRALSDPYPSPFTFHRDRRIEITRASVSQARYGGTPGRIFIREGNGVVIVAGALSRRGTEPGLVVETVRLDDGTELPATEYFTAMGGYLTSQPIDPNRSLRGQQSV